jgi:hypothetical protein
LIIKALAYFVLEGGKMKRMGILAALVLAALPTDYSPAQTSEQYAVMGRKLWAAFECAALADVIDDAEEKRRLFNIGYEQGKIFLNALQGGKIEKQDIERLPMAVSVFLPGGPTVDFILGRLFETAFMEATKGVIEARTDRKTQSIIAEQNFAKKNCRLL